MAISDNKRTSTSSKTVDTKRFFRNGDLHLITAIERRSRFGVLQSSAAPHHALLS
jgi:hypothetical protein